ncbi:GNAT family N-acetyltransferase [Amycolatopsis methanolica]|uniref:GCN5-like N-acetyltransferase n=1 Tax=Amycolatopsis methanolica 239 TaxID=1068978 RepID=A0A076MWC7_AMYME|nr:GNAT family N-acetyltransferase [Amycolatopsis methanolica]AIJ23060.1 GCN5-like N-acetyltransferase [Amycolatopsis methanolica 239]
MPVSAALLSAQRARFSALDPLLPPAAPQPEGEVLVAATADGTRVTGVVQVQRHQPGAFDLLWSAEQVWQLFPCVGDTGTAGMDALLRAWRRRMDQESPGADSSCTVTWPSRDAEAVRAFLDHGLVPLSVLAVRTGRPAEHPPPPGVTIRRARPEDLEEVVALSLVTFRYSSLVAGPWRPGTAELITPRLERNLAAGAPVWLAERDGVAVALADCGWVESAPGSWAAELLPAGQWGYVNNVATSEHARGEGIGRALLSRVHREFADLGARATYLYYNPANPLSSVFWPRQGYRPLWSYWEVRPASALR